MASPVQAWLWCALAGLLAPTLAPVAPQQGVALALSLSAAALLALAPRRAALALALFGAGLAWSQQAWSQRLARESAPLPTEPWVEDVRLDSAPREGGWASARDARFPGLYWELSSRPLAGEVWRLVLSRGSSGRSVRALAGVRRHAPPSWQRLNSYLADTLERGAGPGWKRESALARAMTLGRGDALGDHWGLLRRTQTVHIAVVSGLHLGVVAGAVLASLALLARWWPGFGGVRRRLGILAAVLAAAAFGTLAGWPVSAQRAALMGAVAALPALLRAPRLPLPALLALCLLGLLLLDPVSAAEIGAWLSLGLVGAILALGRASVPGSARPAWSPLKWLGMLVLLLRVQLAVFAALVGIAAVLVLPVRISSVPVNLVAVPLASVAVVASLLSYLPAALLDAAPAPLDAALRLSLEAALWPCRLLWWWLEAADRRLAGWPLVSFPTLAGALGFSAAALLLLAGRHRTGAFAAVPALAASLWSGSGWILELRPLESQLWARLQAPGLGAARHWHMCGLDQRRGLGRRGPGRRGPGRLEAHGGGLYVESVQARNRCALLLGIPGIAEFQLLGKGDAAAGLAFEIRQSGHWRASGPADARGPDIPGHEAQAAALGLLRVDEAGRMTWRGKGAAAPVRSLRCRPAGAEWDCRPPYQPWWALPKRPGLRSPYLE